MAAGTTSPDSTVPAPGGRPADTDVTKRILAATVDLVAQHGYDALRMEHVAKQAGCGKPAIYRRYTDKAELVAAAAMTVLQLGDLPDTGNVEEDLLEHALVNRANQQAPGAPATAGSVILAAFEPAVFALLWEQFFRHRRDQGAAIIERAITRGELPVDVDVDVLLDTIAGLTLYRQTVKQIDIPVEQYRAVIAALVAHPPRRSK
ncbi:TetR/AcrR family transcriptional regulator [Rhodococcus sp. HNM0563]|uniref:TetR/AcrR family transcriptional regulator n=1 Tax=Rhodococcus sp. HNM0563 TaxID=2716339 RepID=UPI00146E97D9|nr:TetR/AcrR family transcriptional regulator [Rhodococcus sp. HNM0563]NLU64299.1 TetR/AcrR family transcriptional regulator [Rhodococcus sp. HNM0563]